MAKKKAASKLQEQPPQKMIFLPTFFFGMFVCAFSVFMMLSILTSDVTLDPAESAKSCVSGLVGAWLAYWGVVSLGIYGAAVLTLLCFLWGARIMRGNAVFSTWPGVLGGVIMAACVALLAGVFCDSGNVLSGGLISSTLLPPAEIYFGGVGVAMAAVVLFLIGAVMAFGAAVFNLAERAWYFGTDLLRASFLTMLKIAGAVFGHLRPRIAAAVATAGQGALVPVRGLQRPLRPQRSETTDEEDAPEQKPRTPTRRKRPEPEPEVAEDLEEADESAEEPEEADYEPEDAEEEDSVEVAAAIIEDEASTPSTAAAMSINPFNAEEALSGFGAPLSPEESSANAEDVAEICVTFADEAEEEQEAQEEEYEDLPEEEQSGENPYEKLAREETALKRTVRAPAPVVAEEEEEDEPEQGRNIPEEDMPRLYELPPLELLDEPPPSIGGNPAHLEKRAQVLESTLGEFSIQGKVVHIERGPRITQFEMTLAPGIKLSRVSGLADNLAMALKAPSVRIIAPIPGRDTIGIEIPNIDQELVALRDIVEAVCREKRKQMLPLCLAKDVSGKPIVADLSRMPHLLIAGATGSGKSVCINSIIMSFLTCLRPDECKLIMVDPKVVELSRFKDIPHLMSPVITDMQKAVGVLEWACQEMDQRYEKLSMVSVNNLAKFNALTVEEIEQRVGDVYGEEELSVFPRRLPCIVIIIDELADLMMVAKKDVEHHIARLAAKSRAVGIHLILATQRPSTDVITGLIKANMPARIAFQVASKIDSRTILDQMGADALLGQGDMLYLPPGVGKVQRAQGVYVSDEELFKVVDHCKKQCRPQYHRELEGPVIGGSCESGDVSEYDEFFLESARLIIESERGSVSLLQRKLGIGYGRASRIIDQLAEARVLGPFREGKAREILMDMEQYEARFFGGVFGGNNTQKRAPAAESLAGLREDENEPQDVPWDE